MVENPMLVCGTFRGDAAGRTVANHGDRRNPNAAGLNLEVDPGGRAAPGIRSAAFGASSGKARPGLDPGRVPVFRKDLAPPKIQGAMTIELKASAL
jgi:hypothetical protein